MFDESVFHATGMPAQKGMVRWIVALTILALAHQSVQKDSLLYALMMFPPPGIA